jgi:hypothetical protein
MFMTDSNRRFFDDQVKRTLVAHFPGSAFVAEKGEDGTLSIYHVGVDALESEVRTMDPPHWPV